LQCKVSQHGDSHLAPACKAAHASKSSTTWCTRCTARLQCRAATGNLSHFKSGQFRQLPETAHAVPHMPCIANWSRTQSSNTPLSLSRAVTLRCQTARMYVMSVYVQPAVTMQHSKWDACWHQPFYPSLYTHPKRPVRKPRTNALKSAPLHPGTALLLLLQHSSSQS
jgi:hypothetical protein